MPLSTLCKVMFFPIIFCTTSPEKACRDVPVQPLTPLHSLARQEVTTTYPSRPFFNGTIPWSCPAPPPTPLSQQGIRASIRNYRNASDVFSPSKRQASYVDGRQATRGTIAHCSLRYEHSPGEGVLSSPSPAGLRPKHDMEDG